MENRETENNCKTRTANKNDVEKTRPRSPSILTAIDSVHRSLLLKNCEYEGEEEVKPKLPPRREKDAVYLPITWIKCNNYKRDDFIPEVGTTPSNRSSEKCTTIILNNNTKTLPQQKQYSSNNYNSSSDSSSVMQNIRNSECERLSRKCEKGMCYCFSSDSDASSALQYPQIRKYVPKTTHSPKNNSPQKTCDSFTVHPNEINCSSQNNLDMNIVNKSKQDLSVQCGVAESSNISNGGNGTLKQIKIKITTRKKKPESEVNRQLKTQDKPLHEISTSEMSSVGDSSNRFSVQENNIRNIMDRNRYLYDVQHGDQISQPITTDEDEFYDCNDKKTTDTSSSSVYEDSTEYSQEFYTNAVTSDNIQEEIYVEKKSDIPLIHIVQEISQQMVVTSTVTVNRDKMKKKEKASTKPKKPKKCKKIIDENFCNEILDQTLNWESLLHEANNNNYDDDLNVSTNTSLDTEDFISLGRLEALPKYSGKTIGYLMAKRLKKADKIKRKKEIVDNAVYGWKRDIELKASSDLPSSDSSSSLQGPKKPPRTFASSPSRVGWDIQSSDTCLEANDARYDSVARDYDYTTQEVGWTFKDNSKRETLRKKSSPKPSCPTIDDLTRSLEWMHPVKPNVHNIYYMTVEDNSKDVLKMLNFDGNVEKRKNKQRAVPQVPINDVQENTSVPIENIDTVDGPIRIPITKLDNSVAHTPTKQNSILKFGAGLSPKKFNPDKNWVDRSYTSYGANARFCRDFITAEKQYYYDYQGNLIRRKIICRHCTRKMNKKHKYKAALRRTKSLFVTSKKTLNKKLFKRNSNIQFEKKLNASDSELYTTPQKLDTTALMNQEFYINGRKSANKSLNLSNKKIQCYTCVDNNSRISNTYYNEDPIDNSCDLPMLQNTSSPIPRAKSPLSPTKNANLRRKKRDLNDFPDEIVPLESSSSENFNFQRTVSSPKSNPKFPISPTKARINNLKLTPKKLFKIKSNSNNSNVNLSTVDDKGHSYKSYNEDDEINILVMMGDYLENLSKKIDQNIDVNDNSEYARKYEHETFQRSRRISTSSECVDKLAEKIIKIDLHNEPEPLYAEIGTKFIKTPINSPKKLNVNEIYVNRNNNDPNSPNKYIIVNNDPKAIYATVNKKRNLAKCESLSSGSDDIGDCNDLLKKAYKSRSSTPSSSNTTTTTATHDEIEVIQDYDDESLYSLLQDLKNVEVLKMEPVTNKNIAAEMTIKEKVKEMQNINYIKSSYDKFRNDIPNKNNGTLYNSFNGQGTISPNKNDISSYDASKFLHAAIGDENSSLFFTENDIIEMNRVPSNVSLTNFEIMAYREREVKILTPITEASDDLSLNRTLKSGSNKSKLSFLEENNEIGYDTVDCAVATESSFDHGEDIVINYDEIDKDLETSNINPSILCTPTKSSFGSDNNISELITSPEESPSVGIYSPGSMNNKELYRSLKKKLRSSFRKSKQYIKHEGKRLSDLFDDKLSSNKSDSPKKTATDCSTDEHKPNYSDRKAEVLYQKMCSKINNKTTDINDEDLLKLINQITNQRSIRKQLKNAVNICRNTREFEYSTELIEAERLLLISNLKENVAKHELVRIDYMNESLMTTKPIDNCSGTITLSRFEFPLKEMAIYDALFNYFYICVCSYKEQVNATQPVERVGNKVFFDNNFIQFHNIESDYKIRLEVYVLRLRKNIREYSHESKYHLNKNETIKKPFLVTCPSPSKLSTVKLFKSSPSTDNTAKNNGSSPTLPTRDYDSEYSRFKSQGFIELSSLSLKSATSVDVTDTKLSTLRQMVKSTGSSQLMYTIEDVKYFKLNSVAYNANLIGDIKVNVKCEVPLKGSDLNGFLTIGEQIRGTLSWNRRWCKIDGFTLLFWNYPQECFDKEPLLTVDLTQCKNDIIKMADRAICPRSRTFMIEVINPDKNKCKNNLKQCLMSTDNQMDLKIWLNELNHLLSVLKAWKI